MIRFLLLILFYIIAGGFIWFIYYAWKKYGVWTGEQRDLARQVLADLRRIEERDLNERIERSDAFLDDIGARPKPVEKEILKFKNISVVKKEPPKEEQDFIL